MIKHKEPEDTLAMMVKSSIMAIGIKTNNMVQGKRYYLMELLIKEILQMA